MATLSINGQVCKMQGRSITVGSDSCKSCDFSGIFTKTSIECRKLNIQNDSSGHVCDFHRDFNGKCFICGDLK